MLKRYQVLLETWQMDEIELIAEKFNLSLSETIRLLVCFSLQSYCNKSFTKHLSTMFSSKENIDDFVYETRKIIEKNS